MSTSKLKTLLATLSLAVFTGTAQAATFQLDPAHSFVQFKIAHLGYSVLVGRFNEVEGSFEYDADNPDAASIRVTVPTASLDSNHAKRDKHLRGGDFLHVDKHPLATFVSTRIREQGEWATVEGELTLHGVTRPVTIEARLVGNGEDPWGGYRRGYEGSTEIALKDFGIDYDLGPASRTVKLELFIEGIRQ